MQQYDSKQSNIAAIAGHITCLIQPSELESPATTKQQQSGLLKQEYWVVVADSETHEKQGLTKPLMHCSRALQMPAHSSCCPILADFINDIARDLADITVAKNSTRS